MNLLDEKLDWYWSQLEFHANKAGKWHKSQVRFYKQKIQSIPAIIQVSAAIKSVRGHRA